MKNKLTEQYIQGLQASGRVEKHYDGGRVYLLVTPKGLKHWRMGYRFQGREKTMCFGAYPDISLEKVRDLADKAKKRLLVGIDPRLYQEAEEIALGARKQRAPRLKRSFARQLHHALPFLEVWWPYICYLKIWGEKMELGVK